MQLILASQSPRRRSLLKSLHIPFRVVVSGTSEKSSEKNPVVLVKELALRKARAVSRRVKMGFVLGADTVVVLNGKILGKPRDSEHAYRMLSSLAGTLHRVYTGVAVIDAEREIEGVAYAVSQVRMKRMPPDVIRRLSRKHLDKSGSYAIQGEKDGIARVVKGSYDNVVGLPLVTVKRLLKAVRLESTRPRR